MSLVAGGDPAGYNGEMPSRYAEIVACLVAVPLLSGCGAFAPFTYTPHEYDRKVQTTTGTPRDQDQVTICYSGFVSTDRQALQLADLECQQFGKSATPAGEGFGNCPLFTPVEARFACVKPDLAASSDAAPVPADAACSGGC